MYFNQEASIGVDSDFPRLVLELPFVKQFGDDIDLWAPAVTGDEVSDQALGEEYADALVRLMTHTDAPELLGWVMLAIGPIGPIELGFLRFLASAAIDARRVTRIPVPANLR